MRMDVTTMTALGRQALALAAAWLREGPCRSRPTLLVPWFSCQTMIAPWQLEGYRVRRLGIGDDLLLDADDLAGVVDDCLVAGESPVVLCCETFGMRPGPRLTAALGRVREEGVPVVVDRTHSFLASAMDGAAGVASDAGSVGDIEIVSTRKILPIAELAWVRCDTDLSGRLGDRTGRDRQLTAARRTFLAQRDLDSFESAEDLADECWTPVPPAESTLASWEHLDLRAAAGGIVTTHRLVDDELGGLVVNSATACPAVLRHPCADRVADELRGIGIVGPLHWDRPDHLDVDWPTDLVSLPPVLTAEQVDQVREVCLRLD